MDILSLLLQLIGGGTCGLADAACDTVGIATDTVCAVTDAACTATEAAANAMGNLSGLISLICRLFGIDC